MRISLPPGGRWQPKADGRRMTAPLSCRYQYVNLPQSCLRQSSSLPEGAYKITNGEIYMLKKTMSLIIVGMFMMMGIASVEQADDRNQAVLEYVIWG